MEKKFEKWPISYWVNEGNFKLLVFSSQFLTQKIECMYQFCCFEKVDYHFQLSIAFDIVLTISHIFQLYTYNEGSLHLTKDNIFYISLILEMKNIFRF